MPGWLVNILHSGAAWIATLVIGIGVVWKFLEKYTPKVKKALRLVEDISKMVNDFIDASADKTITKEELEMLLKDLQHLQEELKK